MKVSDKALAVIKHHEGTRMRPYRCPALLWTIGVGHVLYPAQGKLKLEERMAFPLRPEDDRQFSMEEVNGILANDLQRFELGVERFCPVPLIRGDKEGAADELLKYCMAAGKILKGLQNRRIDERAMFLS